MNKLVHTTIITHVSTVSFTQYLLQWVRDTMLFRHLLLNPLRHKMAALLDSIIVFIMYIPRLIWVLHHIVKLNRFEWVSKIIMGANHQMRFGSYSSLNRVKPVVPHEVIMVETSLPLNVIFK